MTGESDRLPSQQTLPSSGAGGVADIVRYPDASSRSLSDIPPGRRTTANKTILLTEAQRLADGEEVRNAAIPFDDDTARAARQLIESEGLEPAWDVERGPRESGVRGGA